MINGNEYSSTNKRKWTEVDRNIRRTGESSILFSKLIFSQLEGGRTEGRPNKGGWMMYGRILKL
jgi:hypothetical protein